MILEMARLNEIRAITHVNIFFIMLSQLDLSYVMLLNLGL